MKPNKCKCGSSKTTLKYGIPCDFGRIVCLDCGNVGPWNETTVSIEREWNENNPKPIESETSKSN